MGIGKRGYLYEELGEGTVELMKSIKRLIDPYNLFNPGKVRMLTGHAENMWLTGEQLYPDDLQERKV